MKITFDILKVILPAITTGLFTFIITKYTYDKNRPLDKLEMAYNRVYYPIYKIISDKNLSMEAGIDKINIYLLKYNKYADISTTRIFMSLYECKKETKKKLIYQNPESVKLIVFICQSTIRLAKSRKCTLIMLNKPVLM